MKRLDGHTAGAFVAGLGLGVFGSLVLSPQEGRRVPAQLVRPLADLYYELEPRLVAVRMEDIVLHRQVGLALRSAGLAEGVGFSVWGRSVRLNGTARDAETIYQIERVVCSVPGVRKVVNRLCVSTVTANPDY